MADGTDGSLVYHAVELIADGLSLFGELALLRHEEDHVLGVHSHLEQPVVVGQFVVYFLEFEG